MRAQSKDLEPVSVMAEAENRSNTQAYHTELGETINAPLSIVLDTWRPYHDVVQSMTAIERFLRKWIAVHSLHTLVLGVSDDQAIEQSKMRLCVGLILAVPWF